MSKIAKAFNTGVQRKSKGKRNLPPLNPELEGKNLELRRAAQRGDLKMVKKLLKGGAKIHAGFDAALRDAVREGHKFVVAFLLDQGADPHTLDDAPIAVAKRLGHTDIEALLEEKMEVTNAKTWFEFA